MARPPLSARPPTDPAEERPLGKLASARHAPASLLQRARVVTGSWDGASVRRARPAARLPPKTVSKWLHRFNEATASTGWPTCPARGCPGG